MLKQNIKISFSRSSDSTVMVAMFIIAMGSALLSPVAFQKNTIANGKQVSLRKNGRVRSPDILLKPKQNIQSFGKT